MNKILEKIKSIFRRQDRDGLSVFGRSQHFDWEVLLTLSLGVIIIVVLVSVQVFLGVKKGDIFNVEKKTDVPVSTINRDKIDAVIDAFARREQQLTDLQTNKPVSVDPSL